MKENNNVKSLLIFGGIFILLVVLISCSIKNQDEYKNSKSFNLISSSENKVFDSDIKEYLKKENLDVNITYEDTQKIITRLNNGESFDSVWLSNSIWTYKIDSKKNSLTNTKSTSISPIIFGIKKSKAEELGLVNKTVYTKDLINLIKQGKLKFAMSNPTTTNSGAAAYLGILSTLAGNPEVLTSQMLEDESLKENLKAFFSGVERNAGDEDFLEEAFINGDYEAVFAYESSIININKKLERDNKEYLYTIYPVDGMSISDSPIYYIDKKNNDKKEIYDKLTSYILGNEGQKVLASYGRRTWYGGTNPNADQSVFNSKWGIDTTKYISPIKYPSTTVINQALALYQRALRKPIHVVFCLDYSGSMYGDGFDQLVNAMDYILTDRAENELLQFSSEDKIDIVPFSDKVYETWSTNDGSKTNDILENIKAKSPSGTTALYPAAKRAVELLSDEDRTKYNTSVILLTDGEGNVGRYSDLEDYYKSLNKDIPIYSIQFLDASPSQLNQLANLSNGKVFDGSDLVSAFKEVRGYN